METVQTADRSRIAHPPVDGVLEAVGSTPLVRLRRYPGLEHLVVFAKLETVNPGGSAKDRPAARMIAEALEKGRIGPGSTVIESSSGNMAIGLAQACAFHGLRLICVLDRRTNETTVSTLEALGADVRIVTHADPDTGDLLTARLNLVAQLAEMTPGSFWPDQYANEANPAAHAEGTMREIDEALEGNLDWLVAAAGTAGTVRGCAEYLRDMDRATRLAVVDSDGSVLFGGVAGKRRLPGHGAGVESTHSRDVGYDRLIRVSDLECVVACRRLATSEGILAGASSGAVLSALERIADELMPGTRCALILPDRGTGYLETVYDDGWVAAELECEPRELRAMVRGDHATAG